MSEKPKDKKVPLPEKTYQALEKKAKAEGKTPDDKAKEIIEEKTKPKTEFKGKVNKYAFLHIEKRLYEALGWEKGEDIAVKITQTANGFQAERA